jgi:SnoaL-like domain
MSRTTIALAALLCLATPLAQAAPAARDMQQVQTQLDALGKRITRLQDMTDVEIVQDAYGYYVDKGQWRSISDLFADDATLEIGGKGVFLGKQRVFEYMNIGMGGGGHIGPRDGSLIDHQQFQCLAQINADGVTAEQRCIAFVMSSGGWGHCYYENRYVKENGVWKLKKLNGPFNMYAGYKVGWEDNVIVNTFPEKFKPYPDLPPSRIYLTYPNYYVEPYDYVNPVTGNPMPPHSPRAGGLAFGK